MAVSINNLWKLLIDKKMNKSELCKIVKISSSTMAKRITYTHATPLHTISTVSSFITLMIAERKWSKYAEGMFLVLLLFL